MKLALDKIRVMLNSGETVEAEVLDFHPYEPAAYCTDPGWSAVIPHVCPGCHVRTSDLEEPEVEHLNDCSYQGRDALPCKVTELFISESGLVYEQPSNEMVGVAPEFWPQKGMIV